MNNTKKKKDWTKRSKIKNDFKNSSKELFAVQEKKKKEN